MLVTCIVTSTRAAALLQNLVSYLDVYSLYRELSPKMKEPHK